MFDEIASYSYQIGLILIALVTTIKDWEDFSKARTGRFTPVVVVVFTLLLGFLSIQQTHSQIAKERKASGETVTLTTKVSDSNGRISELTKQIDLLQAANARDTQSFQTSFSKLYDRFSDLQSKVRNQELLKELSDTKKELVATQQKLVIPKIKPL